nr:protein ALTERED PHOSPHATE STARVATION RESPONSE 1 [Aegilops tauschii subsp. strangulata]
MGCAPSHDAFKATAAAAARETLRRATTGAAAASSSRRARGPAAQCRQRVALIRAAADRRFALAAAHAAYFRSLVAVGGALRRFAAAALLPATPDPAASPVLTLPPSPDAKPPQPAVASSSAAAASSLPPSPDSSSSTVSPLSHSLSDSDDDENEHLHALGAAPDTTQHHRHHMRNSATVPTVVYEDPYAEYAEGAASYGYGSAYTYGPYGEPVAEEARPRGPPPTPPPPEASPWDFLDLFTPTPYDQFLEDYPRGMPGETADANRNLPTSSPNYANYAELRRMEGIPELEDESKLEPSTSAVVQDQNVKGNRPAPGPATNAAPPKGTSSTEVKLQSKGSPGANAEANKPLSRNDSVPSNAGSDTNSKKGGRSDAVSLNGANFGDIAGGNSSENKKKKKGVPFGENGDNIVGSSSTGKKGAAVDEAGSIVDADGAGGSHGKSVRSAMTVSSESFSPLHNGERDVVEAMEEVKERFEEALHCGDEVSRMLEVGKVPHRTAPKVLRYFSSRVMEPMSLSVPSSSYCVPKRERRSRLPSTSASSANGGGNRNGSLCSTLEKLCVWEKKLYQEVKDEEKLRTLYEKKYNRLKSLDEQGAEPDAIETARSSVRDLRSKITINIKTAKAFSSKIEKIRDEELYPQLVDLIQGLRRMWKAVLECHEKQLSAIRDSRLHLLKARTVSQSAAATLATLELERELTKWYRCFNKWTSSQRSYVEALNGWLRRWFPEVQDEQDAPDGAPPFSPGKLGARPIFIVSNDWFRAIDLVPKSDALKSIDYFYKLVHELRKRQEDEDRQKRKVDHASRDYNKRREALQRELGPGTGTDMVTLPENRGDHTVDLHKMRRKLDNEMAKHDEVVRHVHFAASATLPVGFVPALEQIVGFFHGNLQVYARIRTNGAGAHGAPTEVRRPHLG